jgi:acetyltransferase-like isoleucine patch superfamily enzyme
MRVIPPFRAFCLSLLLVGFLSLSIATMWLLLGRVPLGDFRGVVLVMAGIVFYCLYAIAAYRLIIHFWPLPEGDIDEGSREEMVYHFHLFFHFLPFDPMLHSELLPIPWRRPFYLALGAHLGRNTYPSGILFDLPLLIIGENTTIGYQAVLCPHLITGKRLSHARIRIGSNATIGAGAMIYGGAVIGDGAIISAGAIVGPYAVIGEHAVVKPCSYVKAHTHVAPGETWSGVPAAVEPAKAQLAVPAAKL